MSTHQSRGRTVRTANEREKYHPLPLQLLPTMHEQSVAWLFTCLVRRAAPRMCAGCPTKTGSNCPRSATYNHTYRVAIFRQRCAAVGSHQSHRSHRVAAHSVVLMDTRCRVTVIKGRPPPPPPLPRKPCKHMMETRRRFLIDSLHVPYCSVSYKQGQCVTLMFSFKSWYVTFSSYISNVCHSFRGVAERLRTCSNINCFQNKVPFSTC